MNKCQQVCTDDPSSPRKYHCNCTKFYETKGDTCIEKSSKCNCTEGAYCDDDGQCVCGNGYQLGKDGNKGCEKISE